MYAMADKRDVNKSVAYRKKVIQVLRLTFFGIQAAFVLIFNRYEKLN